MMVGVLKTAEGVRAGAERVCCVLQTAVEKNGQEHCGLEPVGTGGVNIGPRWQGFQRELKRVRESEREGGRRRKVWMLQRSSMQET